MLTDDAPEKVFLGEVSGTHTLQVDKNVISELGVLSVADEKHGTASGQLLHEWADDLEGSFHGIWTEPTAAAQLFPLAFLLDQS